jgi:hypothetical protein
MNTNKPATINPLAEGQMVIIIARWVLVLTSLFLILADTKSVSFWVIRFEIMVVLLLAVSNFYLVAQVLTKRKTLDLVIYCMSLADLAVISIVVIIQGGFSSNVYTFYFPAMLAFSLAFPMIELYLYLGATVSIYSFICLFTLHNVDDIQTLLVRVLMLTAIAVCGNHFAELERKRRSAFLRDHFMTEQLEENETRQPSPAMPPLPTR